MSSLSVRVRVAVRGGDGVRARTGDAGGGGARASGDASARAPARRVPGATYALIARQATLASAPPTHTQHLDKTSAKIGRKKQCLRRTLF